MSHSTHNTCYRLFLKFSFNVNRVFFKYYKEFSCDILIFFYLILVNRQKDILRACACGERQDFLKQTHNIGAI